MRFKKSELSPKDILFPVSRLFKYFVSCPVEAETSVLAESKLCLISGWARFYEHLHTQLGE